MLHDTRSETPGNRRVTAVSSLDALIGAHPDALLKIFGAGRAADPAELGDTTRGRVLAVSAAADIHLAIRPLVRAIAGGALPWKGKTFDHGGNSGQNVVFGRHVLRFHAEVGPSQIDGKPALVLTYA